MLLELTEVLRCPADHDESFVVCVAYETEGRDVRRGVVGCPACHAEYAIRDGVLDYSSAAGSAAVTPAPPAPPRADSALTPEALATFLDLRGPGGFVLFAGAATRLAGDFAALTTGVHVVAVNPPPEVPRAAECSWVVSPRRLPVKASQVRAVVLGADHATDAWFAEAARVLLRGLRVVAEDERANPDGISELARGAGVFVGEKSGR